MSEQYRGSSSYGSSAQELRLVLLGNISCGKTSSADTILGQLSPVSPSASRSCQLRQGDADGRRVTLVEAPRWYWNGGKVDDAVRKETERGMTLVAPGPHAVLLLVPVSQFTEMEGRVPAELEETFGKEVLDHTMVLLTCGDYLMGRKVEEYLQREHPGLRQVIESCGGRYHVINNRQRQDREQVQALLRKVDSMVDNNGVYHMKTAQERELEKRVNDRKRELMESYRAQKEQRAESSSLANFRNIEMQRTASRAEENSTVLERRSGAERDVTEGRVGVSQVSNGLHSTPSLDQQSYPEPQSDVKVKRSLSFRLTSDGAILSQMPEVKSPPKKISTFHFRMNSFEGKSSDLPSPTSASHSPVFSPPSPTFPTQPASYSRNFSPPPPASPTQPASHSSNVSPPPTQPTSHSSIFSPPPTQPASHSSNFSPTFPTQPTSYSPVFSPPSPTFPTQPTSYSRNFSPPPPSSTTQPASYSRNFSPPPPSSTTQPASHSPVLAPSSSFSPTFSSSPSSTVSAPKIPPSSSLPSSSLSFSSSSSPELRLILLGRSGAGKSKAGNSILGQKVFESYPDSLTPITLECDKKKALVEGRRVAVVDTPDWFNSEKTPDEVRAQISSCVALSSPGPHTFLMCVPLDQPAKTELQSLLALESVFGPEAVQRHTLLLFTYADHLKESEKAADDNIEAYIADQRADLLKLVEKCGDRFHVMEYRGGQRERRNVAELLEKVEQTVKEAGNQYYSCPAFQEAEKKVRQRQVELARERKLEEERRGDVRRLSSERRALYPYMQPLAEAEEEVREEEIDQTRDEAEMSVKTMNIESLPPIKLSDLSPSLLRSVMEKMGSGAKSLPKVLADSSAWLCEGAKKVKSSPAWGTVGSRAQDVQKMVADSAVWGKVGARAGHVSKLVGDRVPKVVVDGSAWVGSGAKAAAASPVWGKVGSGAKLVADGSMRVGAGIGAGAKNLAQSPMWGKVGSGAKTGAKAMAESSVKVGAGISAGAKKVAQSPVWGKMGAGAKAGAKMVAESSVWEKIGNTAKQVPKVVIGGAVLGLVLGVFLGGVIGGAVGAAAGSAVSEVGRRKFANKSASEKADDAAKSVERAATGSVEALRKQGEKVLKTE